MRAITVCVDFADVASLTIPYNAHHFDEVYVVTSSADEATRDLCIDLRREGMPIQTVVTDAFYERGASFAKWKALELGLDVMGRHGWLALLDIDILWPKVLVEGFTCKELEGGLLCQGRLYTPKRRMYPSIPTEVPEEQIWKSYPLHPQQVEWAGYTQIFKADDPVLGPPPWHDTRWVHAGGADSFLQAKWPVDCKLRPLFEVLHLGTSGCNWCGRVVPYADGKLPDGATDRATTLRSMLLARRGKQGDERFAAERLS